MCMNLLCKVYHKDLIHTKANLVPFTQSRAQKDAWLRLLAVK